MTIFLLNKEVNLDKSELLLSLPFADASDLEQLELASGSWGIENGAPGPLRRFPIWPCTVRPLSAMGTAVTPPPQRL